MIKLVVYHLYVIINEKNGLKKPRKPFGGCAGFSIINGILSAISLSEALEKTNIKNKKRIIEAPIV